MQPRSLLRLFLFIGLLLASSFAAWVWLRPYTWQTDPAARATITETLVTRDRSNYWVNVHLKVKSGQRHDMQKPVSLIASGKPLVPAESTFGSSSGQQETDEIWLRFWLDAAELQGPLTLQINDGKLEVKATDGVPDLKDGAFANFTTSRW